MSDKIIPSPQAGVTFQAPTEEDLPAMAELIARIATADDALWVQKLEDLRNEYQLTHNDPLLDWLVARDDHGVLRGYAQVLKNPGAQKTWLFGGVDPEYRGRGMGQALLQWQQQRTWQRFPVGETAVARGFAEEENTAAQELFSTEGFKLVRYFSHMERDLRVPLPEIEQDPGLRLERFSPERSEQTRMTHNEVFKDHWGSEPRDQQSWEQIVTNSKFRPDWCALLIDPKSDEVVAYQLASYDPEVLERRGRKEGYSEYLGVRRDYRGRGLAGFLLVDAMRQFKNAGMDWAILEVDTENPSGAVGIYERLGYRMFHRERNYDKTLEAMPATDYTNPES